MFLNWGLEARKFQYLVSKIEKISFVNAYRAIFTGLAFALNTINRSGDFVGRILYLKEGNRLRGVALSLVGSMSQIVVTFSIGLIALIDLRYTILNQNNHLEGLNEYWMEVLIILLFYLQFFISMCHWLHVSLKKFPLLKSINS